MSDLILLIDDDDSLLAVTEYNLTSAGFSVITASSGEMGLAAFKKEKPSLVITDVKLGDISGLELVTAIKAASPETQIIVFTAFGSIEMAVEAMRRGAFNFIPKPFDRETLRLSCKKALEFKSLKTQNTDLVEEIEQLTGTAGIKTASSVMQKLLDTAVRVAGSEASVMITGESGTGKEVLARLIHQNSSRKKGPMICVNCAAIPDTLIESELFGHVKGSFTGAVNERKGKFLSAKGGTLFLDEIAEMKTEMQAKLLRAVQEMAVEPVGSDKSVKTDFRLITATNQPLQEMVDSQRFREDLFYRISVIPLHIPPLRERTEDILLLANHFLKQFKAPSDMKFSHEAVKVLSRHRWPGNIRELQNTVERAVILGRGKTIDAGDLNLIKPETKSRLPEIPDEGLSLEDFEKKLIQSALKKAGGNRSEAARLLKIHRHVLIYRLEKFNIN